MRDFEVVNNGKTTYLRRPLFESDHVDSTDMGMLLNNRIEGIAPISYVEEAGELVLRYDIGQKSSLSDCLSEDVPEGRFIMILRKMTASILHAEDYLLDLNKYLYDSEYVFVGQSMKEMGLIYMPIEEYSSPITYLEFCRKLMEEYSKNNPGMHVYLNEVRDFLAEAKGDLTQLLKLLEKEEMDIMTGKRKSIVLAGDEKKKPVTASSDSVASPERKGKGGPVILQGSKKAVPEYEESPDRSEKQYVMHKPTDQEIRKTAGLVRESTNEKVIVTGRNFIIGASPELCQYCVPNNNMISRRHARIMRMADGTYCIQDIRSKNGTYVDGRRLEAGQVSVLRHGTRIRLADESFIFQTLI